MELTKEKILPVQYTFGEHIVEARPYGNRLRYYKPGERKALVSVTRVSGMIDKSAFLVPWAVKLVYSHILQQLEARHGYITAEEVMIWIDEAKKKPDEAREGAASIGKEVHQWAHDFAKSCIELGEILPIPENEKVQGGIQAFLDWYNSHHVVFKEMEKLVYYRKGKMEYVGLVDAIAEVDGVLTLIDYKTSKGIYSDQFYQLAAYREAYNLFHEPVKKTVILNFDKESGALIEKEIPLAESKKDFAAFCGLYKAAVRERELNGERK